MNFSTKPRHVTPQIDCLGEMSTVLRVSTHIYVHRYQVCVLILAHVHCNTNRHDTMLPSILLV